MRLPICVTCEVEMRCKKNGVVVETMVNEAPFVGTPFSEEIRSADMYQCPACDLQIVIGMARKALALHSDEDYAAKLETYPDRIKVYV